MDASATTYNVQHVYSNWKDTILVGANAQYDFAFSIVGGNTTSGANSIPYYTFLINAWRIKPDEANHTLEVTTGVLLVDGGGAPFVNTTGSFVVQINYQQPVQAIAVSGGGGGASAADVWAHGTRTLTGVGSSGLATEANVDGVQTSVDAIPTDPLTVGKFLGLK
jgi:hypothetical protein